MFRRQGAAALEGNLQQRSAARGIGLGRIAHDGGGLVVDVPRGRQGLAGGGGLRRAPPHADGLGPPAAPARTGRRRGGDAQMRPGPHLVRAHDAVFGLKRRQGHPVASGQGKKGVARLHHMRPGRARGLGLGRRRENGGQEAGQTHDGKGRGQTAGKMDACRAGHAVRPGLR